MSSAVVAWARWMVVVSERLTAVARVWLTAAAKAWLMEVAMVADGRAVEGNVAAANLAAA